MTARFLWQINRWRLWVGALLLGVILAATFGLRHYGPESWNWLVTHERQLRAWVDSNNPWMVWLCGLLIFTFISFVPGLAGKSLVVAWVFGFWPSVIIVNVGLTIVALVEFGVSRWLVRSWIEQMWPAHVARLRILWDTEGAFYLFAARVAHVPYTLTNYLMGATPIDWFRFWWTTQLGLLPGNVIFCYAGSSVPSLNELTDENLRLLWSPRIVSALLIVAVAPWLLRHAIAFGLRQYRWYRRHREAGGH